MKRIIYFFIVSLFCVNLSTTLAQTADTSGQPITAAGQLPDVDPLTDPCKEVNQAGRTEGKSIDGQDGDTVDNTGAKEV